MGWSDRFAWSGEIPLTFPGLNPVALSRTVHMGSKLYQDAVTPSRRWERLSDGALDGQASGPWGLRTFINGVDPATEKGRFVLPNFSGLWPSSGKLLIGLWVQQGYTMMHNPLMSTRGGVTSDQIVYLATASSGRPRHAVYNAAGASVLDQFEDPPWTQTPELQFLGQLVDFTAQTSQLISVDIVTKAAWVGPVRALSGAPNPASAATLDIFGLQNSGYWAGGNFDEVLVAHPTASFDLTEFADRMALSLWADSQSSSNAASFSVSETGVTAVTSRGFQTGAERVSWENEPVVTGAPAGSVPYWSSDNGATWNTGASLPFPFTGQLRWEVPLTSGQVFSGIEVVEPSSPPPTLGVIPDVTLEQGDLESVALTFTASGSHHWDIVAPSMVGVTIEGSTLSVAAGFEVGDSQVSVTLFDELGRSVTRTFLVTVIARSWVEGPPPEYPHAPVMVWGTSQPEAVLIDPLQAVVKAEVNGAQTFTLTIPVSHRVASMMVNERRLTVAGETYWIRTVTTARSGLAVLMTVMAEARFYELATARQIDAREWQQVTAGDVMSDALQGTGWAVDVANVTTLRTYTTEDTNPLALLREVQKNHGGDLVFNNPQRLVSLVSSSGRDQGIGFFYGKGVTSSKRVVDTTGLVTRIYAKNADGVTIAGVNGGVPYLEDFSYTSEIKTATYDFKAGTSPFTMLSMAQATLASRSKPRYSYEVTVNDLSARTDADKDRFTAGDYVTVVDEEVGISSRQRIVVLEYDVIRPWASQITLSAKLRELGSTDQTDSGVLTTGSGIGTFDLVPFNLLLNSRFDNALAHWANFGVEIVDGNGTGDKAVRFSGPGERWIEQTIHPDNRDAYAFSFDIESRGPAGWSPNLTVQAEVTYEDGTSETIDIELQ